MAHDSYACAALCLTSSIKRLHECVLLAARAARSWSLMLLLMMMMMMILILILIYYRIMMILLRWLRHADQRYQFRSRC